MKAKARPKTKARKVEVKPPEVGAQAPDFTLPDPNLNMTSLSDFAGRKVVLAFFPAAMSPVCTREMCSFRDSFAELSEAGAQVVAVSIDGPFANKQFTEMHSLNFPVLSDYSRDAVKKYGVVMPDLLHVKGYKAAKRSVFVIDPTGLVKYKWVSDDPLIEPNYEEIKQAIRGT
ncbi:MAG: redoxin domain-containing protein [Nitrososphaerales archaeon]